MRGNQFRGAIAYNIRFPLFLTGWLDDVAFSETQPGMGKFYPCIWAFRALWSDSFLLRPEIILLYQNPRFKIKRRNSGSSSFEPKVWNNETYLNHEYIDRPWGIFPACNASPVWDCVATVQPKMQQTRSDFLPKSRFQYAMHASKPPLWAMLQR
jgi:hypothetical protein